MIRLSIQSIRVGILAVEGCIGRQAEESDVIVYSPCAIVLGVNDFRRRGHDDTVGLRAQAPVEGSHANDGCGATGILFTVKF